MARTDETTEAKPATKLDSEPATAGTGSPMNRKPSPEGQKVQSLNVHRDPYADSKRKR
jgi:hypothetical protein